MWSRNKDLSDQGTQCLHYSRPFFLKKKKKKISRLLRKRVNLKGSSGYEVGGRGGSASQKSGAQHQRDRVEFSLGQL